MDDATIDQQKRDLVRAQSGVTVDDARIDAVLRACGGDEVLATLQLMDRMPTTDRPKMSDDDPQRTIWRNVRLICDAKDREMQRLVDQQKSRES